MARMISIRSPSFKAVAAQAPRGTTAPLSAIAKPLGVGSSSSAVSARHNSARVAEALSRASPLTLSRMGYLLKRKSGALLHPVAGAVAGVVVGKTIQTESWRRARHGAAHHEVMDRLRGDGREQDAVAVMTRRQHQTRDAGRAEDRRIIVRGRPEARPHRLDFHVLDAGKCPPGSFQQ